MATVSSGILFESNAFNLKEISLNNIRQEVNTLLVPDEQIVAAFQTVWDQVVFTTKRLLVVNVKGITGKKIVYFTYPYSKVQYFGIETAGLLDIDCELLLAFNDGTERRAKLGLIEGLSPDAEGTTRCLAPANGRVWESVKGGRAVLPIPYGTTSFQVNGVETPTGLDGAQGWFAMDVPAGGVSLSLVAPGISSAVSLLGANSGMLLIVK